MDTRTAIRIAAIQFQINKILNTDYPDEPKYWESIGRCLANLNNRIALIREGRD